MNKLLLIALALGAAVAEAGVVEFSLEREHHYLETSTTHELSKTSRLLHKRGLDKRGLDKRSLSKRDSATAFSETLDNGWFLYYANVTLGTPGQTVRLQIDTGSSDIWTHSGDQQLCQESDDPCGVTGTFNPDESSTYVAGPDVFYISYADESYAQGSYALDVFGIGGVSVQNMTFGLATSGNTTQGIMGVGYDSNEAAVASFGSDYLYLNLPDELYVQDVIGARAYSLWLNDVDSSAGSVLFGGYDKSKFEGDLVVFDTLAQADEETPSTFLVTLTGIGANGDTISNSVSEPVLLDSGTSYTYIPEKYISDIADGLGISYVEDAGAYIMKCKDVDTSKYMTYTFSTLDIKVPADQVIIPVREANGTVATYDDGSDACMLSIFDSSSIGTSILGDTFLRSAYVVFDIDTDQIGMAQTVFNADSSSDIVEIDANGLKAANGEGSAATASATVTATDVSETATATTTGADTTDDALTTLTTKAGTTHKTTAAVTTGETTPTGGVTVTQTVKASSTANAASVHGVSFGSKALAAGALACALSFFVGAL
ncbi:aspartic peptidase domain-containing protein [Dipodascopsis tothii]|uniref:aspartic peptidase domain-containing protein n=1 Tax=Dipodascopsis tothii TaxID=44089 RepID=UPI0034CED065